MHVYLLSPHHLLRKMIRGYGKVTAQQSLYIGEVYTVLSDKYYSPIKHAS